MESLRNRVRVAQRCAIAWTAATALALALPALAHAVDQTITFTGAGYSPANVTLAPGEHVTWSGDFTAHPLVSDQALWLTVYSGTNFGYTFTTAGTFNFHCENHPGTMTGSVTVTAGGSTPPPGGGGTTPGPGGGLDATAPDLNRPRVSPRDLRSLLRQKRLTLELAANEPASVLAKVLARLRNGRWVQIAKGTSALVATGGNENDLTVRIARAKLKLLRRQRPSRLRVQLESRDAAGNIANETFNYQLRR